jgi:hypothetical protein
MGNGVTNILLIESTKDAQQKTRLYADRWKNEEGKHKIECSLKQRSSQFNESTDT